MGFNLAFKGLIIEFKYKITKVTVVTKFVYIFRLIQLKRIPYYLYVHYNMFRPMFMAIIS